jgi:hypothetical protein
MPCFRLGVEGARTTCSQAREVQRYCGPLPRTSEIVQPARGLATHRRLSLMGFACVVNDSVGCSCPEWASLSVRRATPALARSPSGSDRTLSTESLARKMCFERAFQVASFQLCCMQALLPDLLLQIVCGSDNVGCSATVGSEQL